MQGDVILKDKDGNELAKVSTSHFPLIAECETFIGGKRFVIHFSYMDDPNRHGWKDRGKVKGIVMMKAPTVL